MSPIRSQSNQSSLSVLCWCFCFTTCLIAPPAMTDAQTVANTARIVFLGDSITQQGASEKGYVTLVRQAIQAQPDRANTEIINAGISGNKVPDLLNRLENDVLSKQPTLVVIYIGINDVWHSTRNNGTPKKVFEAGLTELIEKIRAVGSRVILCTPSVIGEKTDGSNDLDAMLEEYCEISRHVAKASDVPLLDLRAAFLTELNQKNSDNQSQGILTGDGVHLNDAGNQLVAAQMLAALKSESTGAAPSEATAKGSVRHIVLFKFAEELEAEEVSKIVDAFAELPKKIDVIAEFEMGTDISPEQLAAGYTHCFIVTFKSVADRDAYLPHPAHQAFVDLIQGKIASALVFDFVVGGHEK